jgi:signal transduction histidine kinase
VPISDDEVRRRKAYLEITAVDEQRLRDAHPHLVQNSREIIDRFYDYLTSHAHTRSMLAAPGLIDRLKQLQARYFDELTAGTYDVAYFENRIRVGQAHDRVGLSPEWYLGAYNKYLQIVSDVLSRTFGRDYERFFQTMIALTKIIYLDMSLAIDAYIQSAHGKLASAHADLKRLEAARQQLADMIVHDLQNPLAGIMAFLSHFRGRGGMSAGESEALEEAIRRCNDLSQMILNVLHVSRADEGRLATYMENVDLSEITRESAAAFQLVAQNEGRAISVEAPPSLPVRTDQSLLRRVVQNLLRNALRHTPQGTPVILRVDRSESGRARLRVSDDGPGIPVAVQPLLFERFGAPALRDAGLRVDTGLGLAFCKVALDAVGGSIAVASDGKRGTTFSIELP